MLELFGCSPDELSEVLALVGDDTATAAAVCGGGKVGMLGAQGAVTRWSLEQLAATAADVADVRDQLEEVAAGLDVNFVLTSAYQVFIMQLGFALFAAGVVRPKNIVAIFLKNLFDTCIAGIAFYLIGYAFAFGTKHNGRSNGFIGDWDFALSATDGSRGSGPGSPALPWHLFIWNWSFCSAATTILSGSIAERATFASYTLYAAVMPAWVYPVVAHWMWSSSGWLSARNEEDRILGVGAIDYAGSGVVHLMGGMAALVGSLAVGPRVGRFSDTAVPAQLTRASASPQLYLMGTLILWFGWYGFNPGSRLEISSYESATVVARTAVTTTLSACAGALTSLLMSYRSHRVWDLLTTCMGALAGLVSVTAGCSVIEPWAAIICGMVASLVADAGEKLLERFKIDDPVAAFPVHGMCGAWGLLWVGLMAQEGYVHQVYGYDLGHHRMGLFYGGHAQLLLCQVIAILVIAGWTAMNMGLLFGVMRMGGWLRVAAELEAAGMDLAACGQVNAHGAVHVMSAKFPSKGVPEVVMAALAQERHLGMGAGFDVHLRLPPSTNPSHHNGAATGDSSPLPPLPQDGHTMVTLGPAIDEGRRKTAAPVEPHTQDVVKGDAV